MRKIHVNVIEVQLDPSELDKIPQLVEDMHAKGFHLVGAAVSHGKPAQTKPAQTKPGRKPLVNPDALIPPGSDLSRN